MLLKFDVVSVVVWLGIGTKYKYFKMSHDSSHHLFHTGFKLSSVVGKSFALLRADGVMFTTQLTNSPTQLVEQSSTKRRLTSQVLWDRCHRVFGP